MNQIKCELCEKWLNVTTIKSIPQTNGKQIVQSHKCEKFARKFGQNCEYCNKHITVTQYDVMGQWGVNGSRYDYADHQCVDDKTKCIIDMERAESESDRVSQRYFESLNI